VNDSEPVAEVEQVPEEVPVEPVVEPEKKLNESEA
jgi:hypothetical protein